MDYPNVPQYNASRRRYLASNFGQLANIFAGTLIIGQFLAPEQINPFAFTVGILGTIGFYISGYFLEPNL